MTACPVCALSLADFDEAASAHHVNLCLDDNAGSGSGSTRKSDVNTLVHAPICPICNAPVQDDVQLEEHVELCLAAQSGSASTSAGRASPASEACPSCLIEWSAIEVPFAAREQHVMDCLAQREALAEDGSAEESEGHWDAADELGDPGSHHHFRSLLSAKGIQNGFGKIKSSIKGKGRADPNTPELVPLLSLLLERAFSSSNASTRSATLCSPNAVHVKSQPGDFGWGCGYRNAQMILAAASRLEQYQDLFHDLNESEEASHTKSDGPSHKRKECPNEQSLPDIPEIQQLQEIAEMAWKKGFDPEGRDHFKGKLVGSRRWIGTSEVYVMLTWLGIRATIIDFPKDKQSRKSGPNSTHHALTKWVFDYFGTSLPDQEDNSKGSGQKNAFSAIMSSGGSAIRVAHDRLPLYLQHQGHSRTIVGVEVNKNGDLNLLVFDPGHAVPKTLRDAALATSRASSNGESSAKKAKNGAVAANLDVSDHHRLLSSFRVNLKSLSRQDEYQILRIEADGPALNHEEKMRRRTIKSVEVTS